ncbi:MAG: Na+ dependent nucleoside transporter domain protein [Cyanobacteria bacterium RYN_339]|nr:Na+ dependent nucleoside transporter domain protein [Cyanobacteria bacterium RYN_339]
MNPISILGMLAILAIAFALSTDRKAIKWRTVGWGLLIQFLLAVFILKTTPGELLFQWLGTGITRLLDFSKVGSSFVFGKIVTDFNTFGFVFAFQVLPTIIFMASLISILYYLGIIQRVVSGLAWLMAKTMGVSGAESLSSAACVFVGQVEGPLMVRPYIETMTKSELMALMTGGMSTIAGGVMAAYIGMLGADWAPHLLAASIMGAPAGLVMAKIIVPETETPVTSGTTTGPAPGHPHQDMETGPESDAGGPVVLRVERTESSVIEAAAKGAGDGMHLAFSVAAMLIAFISLVAMMNAGIGLLGGFVGFPTLSLEKILGTIFYPLAYLIGVPPADAAAVGNMIGKKLVLNEFVAYNDLSTMIKAHQISPTAARIATFALCGFANFSSIAQNVGGVGAMAPSRRGDLARLGIRAMCAGALASCMSAAIAGLLG